MTHDNLNENKNLYTQKKQNDIIKLSLKETYNSLNARELREITRESIFAPPERKISTGGREITASDLRYEIATSIEENASSRFVNNVYDMQTELAENIERINSGTNSTEEYFSWLNTSTDILKNMNDGFVSKEDLEIRNNFLETTDQREADLMLCLGLLAGSKHHKAIEISKNLQYKLQKLREIRSAIKLTTRNQADIDISRAEYERAIPYYKVFKTLQKLPFGYDVAKQQKINLGIYHDEDDDLQEDYNYYIYLINQALDEMKTEDNYYVASNQYQLAHDMAKEQNEHFSDKISDKMQKLTGRRNSFRLKYESLDAAKDNI